jgi:serine/threonine protein kinase
MVRGRKPKSALTVDVNFEQSFKSAPSLFKTVKGVIKHYQKVANSEDFTHLRIKEYLDHGSSGIVIKCTSPHQNDQACVIKLPFDTSPSSLRRVKDDIILWKKFPSLLNNDFLVGPITENTLLPEGVYRMPYWEASLSKIIMKNPFLDARQVSSIVTAMCKGCHALHSLSPPHIHKDIKPANILVKVNSNQKVFKAAVADFGSVHCISHTNSDLELGTTLGYRAPEIAWKFRTGISTDLWSIAVIILELILGHPLLSSKSNNERDLMRAENKLFFSILTKTDDDVIHMLGQSLSPNNSIGTEALNGLMNHKQTISFWDKIQSYNSWDRMLVAVLKKCFHLNPEKRYASVQEFEIAFCNIINSNIYVQDATPLQCPTTTCHWKTIHNQQQNMDHIHSWFVAILWTNNPSNSSFIRGWFASSLITDRAYNFQKAAIKMWSGDPQWISEINTCIKQTRPQSPEEFFSDHMKLPKPLIQDPATNSWKVTDITHEKSTLKANIKSFLYFDTVNNNADTQIGIMAIQNQKGQLKHCWGEVKCTSHPDSPIGSTCFDRFQKKVFIHHIPIKSHGAIVPSNASR